MAKDLEDEVGFNGWTGRKTHKGQLWSDICSPVASQEIQPGSASVYLPLLSCALISSALHGSLCTCSPWQPGHCTWTTYLICNLTTLYPHAS